MNEIKDKKGHSPRFSDNPKYPLKRIRPKTHPGFPTTVCIYGGVKHVALTLITFQRNLTNLT
jgi:hypothetical protein